MNKKNILIASALSAIAFIGNVKFAKFDFDPHHDGYVVAIAVAVRDHGVVFRDVFSQYGSVPAWLQGFWLRFFFLDQPALGLRILNVITISAIVFLLSLSGSNMPKNWHLKPWMGYFAAIAWLILNDVYTGVPMLPWPALIATFLTVLGFVLLGKSFMFFEFNKNIFGLILLYFAGTIFALTFFARQTIGILNVLAFSIFLLNSKKFGLIDKTKLMHGFASLFLTFFTVIIIYFSTGSASDWIYQTLIWPASNYEPNNFFKPLLFRVAKLGLPLLLFFILFYSLQFKNRIKILNKERTFDLFQIFTSFFIYWFLFVNQNTENISPTKYLNLETSKGLAALLEFVSFTVLIYLAISLISFIYNAKINSSTNEQKLYKFLHLALAISCFSQIYPVSDSRHLWWSLPLGILFLFSFEHFGNSIKKLIINPLFLTFTFASVIAINQGIDYLKVKRLPVAKEFVASGMYLRPEPHLIMRDKFEFLIQNIYPYEKALFLTRNGDLSVFDGKFHSIDPYFVYWGPKKGSLKERLSSVDTVVIDTDQTEFRKAVESQGFEVYAHSVHVYMYKRVSP